MDNTDAHTHNSLIHRKKLHSASWEKSQNSREKDVRWQTFSVFSKKIEIFEKEAHILFTRIDCNVNARGKKHGIHMHFEEVQSFVEMFV